MDENTVARYFRNRFFEEHIVTLVEVNNVVIKTLDTNLSLPNEVMEVEFSSNGQSWFRQEHVLNRYSIDDLIQGVLNSSLK